MPAQHSTHDVVVIGGGPGGYAAALYGASAGLNVAIVERDKVGGTCLHRGCVHAGDFGFTTGEITMDFAVSQQRKRDVVDGLFKGLSGLLSGRKVSVVTGTGRLRADRTVEIIDGDDAGSILTAPSVILAAGSAPRTLPGFEVDGKLVYTSDEFLELSELPRSAAVIGGGAIGCEFASMLVDMGVAVTVLEALPSILTGCDADVVAVAQRAFKKKGIEIRTGVTVTGHVPQATGTAITIEGAEPLEVDCVVVSVGRRPMTDGLLDDGTGVVLDGRGFVVADPLMRTGAPGVYAVGDLVAGTPQLAHVGFAEAIVAIKDILKEPAVPVDYDRVPWAIYSDPEVAFCGLTEEVARERGYDVVVKKDPFAGNSRARIIGDTDGVVKVIAERRPDGTAGQLLGVHMAGPWVTEQLGAGYYAVNWEATAEEAAALIQPHPSLSETFGETLLALAGRGLHLA
jgi:dihydrolipoamide dehydrogenase